MQDNKQVSMPLPVTTAHFRKIFLLELFLSLGVDGPYMAIIPKTTKDMKHVIR